MIIGNKILKKAQDYINKCNAFRTVKISKKDEPYIIQFFRGLEKLGILDKCEGVLLRSGQNTGTGTTTITLNGKTTASLINGPLWGTNGILFPNDTYGEMTSFDITEADKFSMFLVSKYSSTTHQVESFGRFQTLGMWHPYADANIYFDADIDSGRLIFPANLVANQWISWIATASSNKKLYKNGILYATENSAAEVLTGPTNIFSFSKNYGNPIITSICLIFNQDISDVAPQLHQLYFNTIGKTLLTFDPDAAAYISATSISSSTEQQNINDFISGLKGLGVWDDLLDGWTLRSTQNYGTGTSVRGLKGIHNGTLVGGPTWGTNGITINNSTYIDIPTLVSASNQTHTFASVVNTSATTALIVAMGNTTNPSGTADGIGFYFTPSGANNGGFPMLGGVAYGPNDIQSTGGPEFDYYTMDINYGAASVVGNGYRDTNTTPLSSLSNTTIFLNTSSVKLGGGNASYSLQGVMSIALMWKKVLPPSLMVQIRLLYKLTIGQGIALT